MLYVLRNCGKNKSQPLRLTEGDFMSRNNYAIIHYDEIGLKGKNRAFFEKLLMRNIKAKLGNIAGEYARESGQIVVRIKSDEKKAREILSAVPGISHFSFAKRCGLDINEMKRAALEALRDEDFETFKIDTKRHNKGFELTSMKVNEIIGEEIVKECKKKVKMKNPDIILTVEISNKFSYISKEKIKGIGGLPTNSRQKIISLISGGFDSPVAAYMMMKRGCEVVFVHCMNQTTGALGTEGKITDLCSVLSKYQVVTRVYIVPFEKIQKEIVMKVKSELRMLVYRHFMIKIAERIGKGEGAKFITVGDSLSQVASQTIENLYATYKNSGLHIFSPLIGLNKSEITDIAKKIGTYEISARPYDDCCSFLVPKHPELRATPEMIKKQAEQFDVEKLVEEAVENSRFLEFE